LFYIKSDSINIIRGFQRPWLYFRIPDFCWYVWQYQVEKTYPLPSVLWGILISYARYQRLMMSINRNSLIVVKEWRCTVDMSSQIFY